MDYMFDYVLTWHGDFANIVEIGMSKLCDVSEIVSLAVAYPDESVSFVFE